MVYFNKYTVLSLSTNKNKSSFPKQSDIGLLQQKPTGVRYIPPDFGELGTLL